VIMSGSLGEWSIEDLLQIARITHKTTCIEVEGRPRVSGAIFLREGAVVDAIVDGAPRGGGSRFSQVVEAIEALASIEDGTFEFSSRSTSDIADRPIEVPAITAAMEKDALREKRLTDLGIDQREGLSIGRHIDGAMSIKPAVWPPPAPPPVEGPTMEISTPEEPQGPPLESEAPEDVLFEPEIFESGGIAGPTPLLPDDQNPWIAEPPGVSDGEPPAAEERSSPEERSVEIFEPLDGDSQAPPSPMHEVVTPSETTLVSDVLGDMRSRFRERE